MKAYAQISKYQIENPKNVKGVKRVKKMKKILATVISILLVVGILPTAAFATGEITNGGVHTWTTQNTLLVCMIAMGVVFAGLLITAAVKKDLMKKSWFLSVMIVVLLAGIGCGAAFGFQGVTSNLTELAMPVYQLPDTTLGALVPQIASPYGTVTASTDDSLTVEVLQVSKGAFEKYIKTVRQAGFTNMATDQHTSYSAANADGYVVSIHYVENEGKMYVSVCTSTFLTNLNYNVILNGNLNGNAVTSNLNLPTTATIGAEAKVVSLVWSSSNPDVVSADGTVNRPASGTEAVLLTAEVEETGEVKLFSLNVAGETTSTVLVAEGDLYPANTAGAVTELTDFVLDSNNNSLIIDLGAVQEVNIVTLTDADRVSGLVPSNLTLWISNDNVTYTQVKGYKMLHDGLNTYLYDFSANGQYVKVHYTIWENSGTFTGAPETMISAGYEEVFGGNEVEFDVVKYRQYNYTGKDQVDYAWTLSKTCLKIADAADSSLRIYMDEEQLYHYVDGDKIMVRVPEIAQGDYVTLRIFHSTDDGAMDVSNKEYVYEVTYGTREIWLTADKDPKSPQYALTLPRGVRYPSGRLQPRDEVIGIREGTVYASTDGITWSVKANVRRNAPEGGTPVTSFGTATGFIFDTNTNRIFAMYYYREAMHDEAIPSTGIYMSYNSHYAYSDDGGLTWSDGGDMPAYNSYTNDVEGDSHYGKTYNMSGCNYNNGTVLSCYDGDGPNVDFVWNMCVRVNQLSGHVALNVLYSRDAGMTWQFSETTLGTDNDGFENGPSEATIYERDDGVLMMLYRLEVDGYRNFGVSYSTDHGVTWSEVAVSNVYAVNCQPIIQNVKVNGVSTDILAFSGFNAMGQVSRYRMPLVFSSTTDNGANFRNIQNIFFQTPFNHQTSNENYATDYCTNISYAKFGKDMYVGWNDPTGFTSADDGYPGSAMVITDFDDWFTKTNGAYDSFEHGSAESEGWYVQEGTGTIDSSKQTDGENSLHLTGDFKASRYIPYLQDGQIAINVYIGDFAYFNMELQSAYSRNEKDGVSPLYVSISGNKVSANGSSSNFATLNQNAWNTIVFDLNLTEGNASVSINGTATEVDLDLTAGDYVTTFMMYDSSLLGSLTSKEVYIDELLVVDYAQ